MAHFLQDRSCNDDFVPLLPPTIVDNSMDMNIEGESMENDNNNEEIIVNVNANDEMDVEACVVQENKKRKREDDDDDDDDEELDEDYEEELDDEEIDEDDDDEDGDVYQHVALLEAENEDLRQQLANANNIIPSRIPFPDGYHIGFEYVNGIRYLFVYQQPQPVDDNGPLSLADLECDYQEEETLSLIRPDDEDDSMDVSK